MLSEQPVVSSSSESQITSASGTFVQQGGDLSKSEPDHSSASQMKFESLPNENDTEEQALESHEVIELQTFSERKAWIEEKITFLEKMPPIPIFVGLDAVRSSAEEIPGLPTRAELQEFLDEHDKIEKETEIFDSGELKKLRKFTKAATQRHLSPEDTDLIELTLTTIYELDKLLHLLRDRSESLDLLGTRLAWEEQRIGSWAERRKILDDLKSFLVTRARWSPSVYDNTPQQEALLTRRGSITSMASMASAESSASSASASSPMFSRSARFKLAELLSRDAAQFASRVSSLRHSKISAAGKALDKLIDNSRKPVPEELLDEQDRLEEKGINEMETIGKFTMNLVMQWRKADEIYVETMKDQVAAQNLLEEIETAKLHHPTSRQSASFVARAEALRKRLLLRGNPASSSSSFPCPVHLLFPDQQSSNEALTQTLSAEIAMALDLVKKVDVVAKEYRMTFEAVRDVEALSQTANTLLSTFTSVHERLLNGVPTSDGDGSPPDLTSKTCLDPIRHSAFLTFLPDILKQSDTATEKTTPLLRAYRAAVLRLDRPGIDSSFKSNAVSEINSLGQQMSETHRVKENVVARVGRLRDARKIWDIMEAALKDLGDTRRQVGDAMERKRWRQQAAPSGTPLTPESPVLALPAPAVLSTVILKQLDNMDAKLLKEVTAPLSSLSGSLEAPLKDWLSQSLAGLMTFLGSLKQMARLLDAIQHQADVMEDVREEVQNFQIRIEDLKIRFDAGFQDILGSRLTDAEAADMDTSLTTDAKQLQKAVKIFMDGLSQRVPFVAKRDIPAQSRPTFVKRRFASVDIKLGASPHTFIELPFDLTFLDDAVRTDSNSYVMRLAGELQSLDTKVDHFQLVQMAKKVDTALSSTVDSIHAIMPKLSSLRASLLSTTPENSSNVTESLQSLLREVDDLSQGYRSQISRSFSPIRELLRQMDAAPGCHDPSVHEHLYLGRTRAVDDAELKFTTYHEDTALLRAQILDAQRMEALRLEAKRVEQEHLEREQLERERLEKERLKQELLEAERFQRERLEKERLETERLIAEQLERESSERERLRKERLEIELLEQDRLEKERLKAEHIERERLEVERLEMERLEKDHLGRLEKEGIEQQHTQGRTEDKRIAEDTRVQLEIERLKQQERSVVEEPEDTGSEHKRLAQASRDQLETGIIQRGSAEVDERRSAGIEKAGIGKPIEVEDDVFGSHVTSSTSRVAAQATADLKARILELRRRLRSISIDEIARPSSSSSNNLPTRDQRKRMDLLFSSVRTDVDRLPLSSDDFTINTELGSLRAEVEASSQLMQRVRNLSDFGVAIHLCDVALSDLLEHVDSYPSAPIGPLASSHVTQVYLPPEEQLAARMSFTKSIIADMTAKFAGVDDDSRAINERTRIDQTWSELEDMGGDLILGKKSRPPSVISSGRSSRVSMGSSYSTTKVIGNDKRNGYSTLSLKPSTRGSGRGRFLSPAHPSSRRVTSGSTNTPNRSTSRLSTVSSSTRSVSGPMSNSSSKLFGSTFASRQRTSSLSSNTSSFVTPVKQTYSTPSRPRTQTGTKRTTSPTFSDASSLSHSHSRSYSLSNSRSQATPSRSTSSMSTWARAPRQSFPLPTIPTPPRRPAPQKKTYVANPKSKLDVAVGNVVNKLPVNINIAMVPETWKDQSGKYWIGDQDPKLCFCRILRSRTVMVRVGGGWTELSKFIQDHFADLFRLLPADSPPRPGAQEKWISSTTLLEAPEMEETIPLEPPRTPEPRTPPLPSFLLSTPNGRSPRSIKSTTSGGSPLTPLQFMRRAEQESPGLRPISPSRPPMLRARNTAHTVPNTPSRTSVWRP